MRILSDALFGDEFRPPNAKERVLIDRRLGVLDSAAMRSSYAAAMTNLRQLLGTKPQVDHLRIREAFMYRDDPPVSGTGSDTAAPPEEDRPPATRLFTPRGITMRFFLIALLVARFTARAGERPLNPYPLRARIRKAGEIGWTDLFASNATASGAGRSRMGVQDKKHRAIRKALQHLLPLELVSLPHAGTFGKGYEEFLLMNEGGLREAGANELYTVPTKSEVCIEVPVEFFGNGWVQVLQDTEIAVLLMIIDAQRGAAGTGVSISADDRRSHYGIGKDALESHRTLNRLGLIAARPGVGRRADGTVENLGEEGVYPVPHVFQFLPDGLKGDAMDLLRAELLYQRNR